MQKLTIYTYSESLPAVSEHGEEIKRAVAQEIVQSAETFEVEDVRDFLMKRFPEWPKTARIYRGPVSVNNDVTPTTEQDVEKLSKYEDISVIVYPGYGIDWAFWLAVIAIAAAVISTAVMIFTMPTATVPETNSSSSNNALGDRQNEPRPKARIPDIYGKVRSTPDLLSTFKVFESNREMELSYLCIGRGAYDVEDVREDVTPWQDLQGASIEVYEPFTSPNSGDEPQLRIGNAIGRPLYDTRRYSSVNGQSLRPPNDASFSGIDIADFVYPNIINIAEETNTNFVSDGLFAADDELIIEYTEHHTGMVTTTESCDTDTASSFLVQLPDNNIPPQYVADNSIELTGALYIVLSGGVQIDTVNLDGTYTIDTVSLDEGTHVLTINLVNPAAINPQWDKITTYGSIGYQDVVLSAANAELLYDLNGTYVIASVTDKQIILTDPASVNSDWNLIESMPDGHTGYISVRMHTSYYKWIGPFTIHMAGLEYAFLNFYAPTGLFVDDGQSQNAVVIQVDAEVTPVDSTGTPTGSPETFSKMIYGSASERSAIGETLTCHPTFTSDYWKIRIARTTERDLSYEGTTIDECKWRDMYAAREMTENDFGDVTTAQILAFATDGALAPKKRKANMLVTRKLPSRVSGSTFTTELAATQSFADILSAICLDPRIGRRQASEIDFDSIYDAEAEITEYFGTSVAAQFNYTFDKSDLSFEETVTAICAACHCVAYRRGQIRVSFERETDDSVLIFNHRNKLPGSETRTQRFGLMDDTDGIEFEWDDPDDDTRATLYLPEDQSAVNPKKIESVGVRDPLQAHFLAWRAWNKIQHQNLTAEFDATQEASLLVLNQRVLNADNTRSGTQDGQVEAQAGLNLTLSQPVTFADGVTYNIFLQLYDETVDSIPITPGLSDRDVVLQRAPLLPLVTASDMYAKTTYMIVGDDSTRVDAFLVAERDLRDNFTSTIRAINYDARYYANDRDYLDGVVDINGDPIPA